MTELKYLILNRLADELKARGITAEDIDNIEIINTDGMKVEVRLKGEIRTANIEINVEDS